MENRKSGSATDGTYMSDFNPIVDMLMILARPC